MGLVEVVKGVGQEVEVRRLLCLVAVMYGAIRGRVAYGMF